MRRLSKDFAILATALAAATVAVAQPFTGFTPGNLVVSRSVYAGDSHTDRWSAAPAGLPLHGFLRNSKGNR